jgi:hypothetical protein
MESAASSAIETLWAGHHQVEPYPRGVAPVPQLIEGTAFFPGGRGLWRPNPPLVDCEVISGGFMILGHDFHSEEGYRASLARGSESMLQPTWRNLLAFLQRAAIQPEICFFTNFYMGLREGSQTTGVFPGAADRTFRGRCLDFLRVQLATYRPQVVLTLGRFVPSLIAQLTPGLAQWAGSPSLQRIDTVGPFVRDVAVDVGGAPLHTSFAALTHPSLRHLSVARRRYRDRQGDAAEHAMVADACQTIRVYESLRREI